MPEMSFPQKTFYGLGLLFMPQSTRAKLDKKPMTEIGTPSQKSLVQKVLYAVNHIPGTPEYEIDILARTLWGEARAEGVTGMQAVANVIVNRAKQNRSLFGRSISAVCLKKAQFSCWNPKYEYGKGSKEYPNILKNYNAMLAANKNTPYFAQAVDIATLAYRGKLADITGGADHYYAKYIPTPKWAVGKKMVSIGTHNFLNA